MDLELQQYLTANFKNTYRQSTEFNCPDGWFCLLLWMGRYIESYIVNQNKKSKECPDKFLPINDFLITKIDKYNGILKVHYQNGNEFIEGAIAFTEYLSGFFCEMCGSTKDVQYNVTTPFVSIHTECYNKLSDEEKGKISKIFPINNKFLDLLIKNKGLVN